MLSMQQYPAGALPSSPRPGRHIDLCDPAPHELARAAELSGVEEGFLEHALDLHECPRIEVDDGATLLILRAPVIETRHGEARHSTLPVGVVITPDTLVTICRQADPALADILRKARGKDAPLSPERLVCALVKGVAQLFMRYLKDISARIQEVEQDLARSRSNDALKLLLNLQKSVTYFHAALKTNDFIIDRLLRKGLCVGQSARLSFTEEEMDGLDDALTDTRQGIYMSKIFNEVLNSITSVYSSIISNSVNHIMKVLTSITVVLMIPTLVTSMYGMNITLPLQDHKDAFALVSLGTAGVTTAIILLLKRSRML
jgi:magnesium transporter